MIPKEIELMFANPDFLVEDTGREMIMTPQTKVAKAITQNYKGVIGSFLMTHGNYDHFVSSYSKVFNVCLTCEITYNEEDYE